jgi:predicted nuclease of predicted toxin-antitoxin system
MKLLFDQNLSFKLAPAIASAFPGSKHVKDFNLEREQDEPIWAFAGQNDSTIVAKDTNFLHLALLRGLPPKVVFLRAPRWLTDCSSSSPDPFLTGFTGLFRIYKIGFLSRLSRIS